MTWTYNGFRYLRRPTRTVHVGRIAIGSEHPIRVQSMTTPSTKDTGATVEQIVRLVEAGCEIVRLTVPTTGDAENLPEIRRELKRLGVSVPLVADIHFTPAAAQKAVEHVEKIRINPGNYADKKKFNVREYTDTEYEAELERIEQVFLPLVLRAKELGVSMRIGTNHGSLSDRIMNRYGDTPLGMVESAMEFVRICEAHSYRELILSMKASNPVVVTQVYRLLAERMAAEKMDYPFHLGVTEAGDGEDGRIKSAVGIGTLLEEGLGDTVRVSLTEDPVAEIPVAMALVAPYNRLREQARHGRDDPAPIELRTPVVEARNPFEYRRRVSREISLGPHRIGGKQPVLVEVPLLSPLSDEVALRRELDSQVGTRIPAETRAELVSVAPRSADELPHLERLFGSMQLVAPRVALSARVDAEWLSDASAMRRWCRAAHRLHIVLAPGDKAARRVVEALLQVSDAVAAAILIEFSGDNDMEAGVDLAVEIAGARQAAPERLMLAMAPSAACSPLFAARLLAARLEHAGHRMPILLLDRAAERGAGALLDSAKTLGGLGCDGIGDAIQVGEATADESRRLAFTILQAARVRITRTEFISCPSCGRTLFDLEETTAKIKSRTAHLKGLKIAVMGCVVNGPGEMADADFGYVGWGEDKIALFVGKDMVAKNIPTAEADDRLVELIKEHGQWIDPPVTVGQPG